jgi:transcriptional regulator with XRE-family HTH domain
MDNMDYGKLGARIKEERIKRHLSREKMAEDLDISASYIGQIERGERCLTVDTLVHVANYYQLSVDYLLRDSLDMAENATEEEWKRLTLGKTSEEKRKLIQAIEAIDEYKGS